MIRNILFCESWAVYTSVLHAFPSSRPLTTTPLLTTTLTVDVSRHITRVTAMAEHEPWRTIASKKNEQRRSRIPKSWTLQAHSQSNRNNVLDIPRTCGLLNQDELSITECTDATTLVGGLISGGLKSVDVVTAFCKRAAIAHQLVRTK